MSVGSSLLQLYLRTHIMDHRRSADAYSAAGAGPPGGCPAAVGFDVSWGATIAFPGRRTPLSSSSYVAPSLRASRPARVEDPVVIQAPRRSDLRAAAPTRNRNGRRCVVLSVAAALPPAYSPTVLGAFGRILFTTAELVAHAVLLAVVLLSRLLLRFRVLRYSR